MILSWVLPSMKVWNALRNLAPFIQFKKREKYPWRSVTTRLHLCISCFLNCINGTKSRKASHIWYLLNHQKEGTRMRLNGTQIIWRKLWNKSSVWNWELAQGLSKMDWFRRNSPLRNMKTLGTNFCPPDYQEKYLS